MIEVVLENSNIRWIISVCQVPHKSEILDRKEELETRTYARYQIFDKFCPCWWTYPRGCSRRHVDEGLETKWKQVHKISNWDNAKWHLGVCGWKFGSKAEEGRTICDRTTRLMIQGRPTNNRTEEKNMWHNNEKKTERYGLEWRESSVLCMLQISRQRGRIQDDNRVHAVLCDGFGCSPSVIRW